MELVQKIDDLGKPAWIVLMVLGFILFWPIGLAILVVLFRNLGTIDVEELDSLKG